MNNDRETTRIRREGYIYLFDYDLNQIDCKKYKHPSSRSQIIDNWKKLYRLQDKKYCIVISPL